MLSVILIMATLTKRTEIGWVTILWCVVKVGYSENYPCILACLRIVAVGVVLNSAELTTIISALQYLRSYLLPVLRITRSIFWLYWHWFSSFFALSHK